MIAKNLKIKNKPIDGRINKKTRLYKSRLSYFTSSSIRIAIANEIH